MDQWSKTKTKLLIYDFVLPELYLVFIGGSANVLPELT